MYFIIAALTFFMSLAQANGDCRPGTRCGAHSTDSAAVKEGSACHKTLAKAAKAWGKVASSTLGGIDNCPEIAAEEIQTLSCKNDITINAQSLSHLQGYMRGEWAEEGIFQIVARRSEAQLQCRETTFDAYAKNAELKNSVVRAAKQKFDVELSVLQLLIKYRAQLTSELREEELAATDRGVGALTRNGREEYKNKIADLDKTIISNIASLPFGYEPEVAKAYFAMAAAGKFDEQGLSNSMAAAKNKYRASLNYYTTHKQPLSKDKVLFCLDEDFRSKAYHSGAVKNSLGQVLETQNNNFEKKLNCRLNATYGKGADRWWYAKNGALLVAYVLAAPEMLSAAGAESLLELKGMQSLASVAAAEVSVAGVQALFATSAISQIHEGCFQDQFEISTSGSATCDPHKDFERVANKTDPAKCALALGFNGWYYGKIANKLIQEARAAVAVGKFARGVASVENVTAEAASKAKFGTRQAFRGSPAEITAQRSTRSQQALMLRSEGYNFNNMNAFINEGQPLELVGSVNGNRFEQMVAKIKKRYPNSKIVLSPELTDAGFAKGYKEVVDGKEIQGVMIEMNPDYLLQHPEDATATLLHETRHMTNTLTAGSKFPDREIFFEAPQSKLVVGSYPEFRADEIEARLSEIGDLKKQAGLKFGDKENISIQALKSEVSEFADVQERYLSSINSAQRAHLEKYNLTAQDKEIGHVRDGIDEFYTVKTEYMGKPVNVIFKVDKRLPIQPQIEKQIATRLKYLSTLKSRITK